MEGSPAPRGLPLRAADVGRRDPENSGSRSSTRRRTVAAPVTAVHRLRRSRRRRSRSPADEDDAARRCAGTTRQRWCSARGANYIRTEQGTVVFADTQPPMVSILQDTPLTQGLWVNGFSTSTTRPQTTSAFRYARAVHRRRAGMRSHDRRVHACHSDRPVCAILSPAPTARAKLLVRTSELPAEGTQPLVVEAEDPAGNRTSSAAGNGADRLNATTSRRRKHRRRRRLAREQRMDGGLDQSGRGRSRTDLRSHVPTLCRSHHVLRHWQSGSSGHFPAADHGARRGRVDFEPVAPGCGRQ